MPVLRRRPSPSTLAAVRCRGNQASILLVYAVLGIAGAIWYLEGLRDGNAHELLQGHRRRQSMQVWLAMLSLSTTRSCDVTCFSSLSMEQFDQFPTTPVPWVCDVLSRSHDHPSVALFLESLACGWDGAHYTFIASHGYRPRGLVYDAVFTDPGGSVFYETTAAPAASAG